MSESSGVLTCRPKVQELQTQKTQEKLEMTALHRRAEDADWGPVEQWESREDATWVTPRDKERKRKSSRARPTRAQAAREREGAIKEASQLSSNPFFALEDTPPGPFDTDTGTPSSSRNLLEGEGPTLTLRIAGDL
ncbi:hypothetical protein NDU88_006532 [Pleurodeles waltl]|uniref:Uncharacterized protein n=1 Tax=Pleurodeles waltl TaxID=8319 RepID=A0AAV7TX41_PLEWA|nr:hypothetical protein NDU88_006532 [Pleurodeles waltl]